MKNWRSSESAALLERLELYISAGSSVDAAIELAAAQYRKARRADLVRMAESVREGKRLSDALAARRVASGAALGLIAHGEASGRLGRSLADARALLERGDELRRSCLSAMTYPAVIGFAACGIAVGLVRGIMPQIIPMLKSLRVPLPPLTRAAIWVSGFLGSFGLFAAAICAASALGLVAAYRGSSRVRAFVQNQSRRIPLVGSLIERYAMSVFLRSCGSLLESGISSPDGYGAAARASASLPLRARLLAVEVEVRRGVRLGDVLDRARFPKDVCGLARAGESSGRLGSTLVRCADLIDRDMGHELKRLTSLVEPAMMLVMGGFVGAVALSIMMPIYDLSKSLQR